MRETTGNRMIEGFGMLSPGSGIFVYACCFFCVCVHLCLPYLWWFEGVVCGEVYGQEENPALVRTVILKQGEKITIKLVKELHGRQICTYKKDYKCT